MGYSGEKGAEKEMGFFTLRPPLPPRFKKEEQTRRH